MFYHWSKAIATNSYSYRFGIEDCNYSKNCNAMHDFTIVYSPLNLLISSSHKNCKSDLNTLIFGSDKEKPCILSLFLKTIFSSRQPSNSVFENDRWARSFINSLIRGFKGWNQSETLKTSMTNNWQCFVFFHLTLHCRQVRALEEALAYWAILNKSPPHKWCPLLNSSTTTLKPLTLKPAHIHTSQLQTAIAQANPSWQMQSTIAAVSPRRYTSPSLFSTTTKTAQQHFAQHSNSSIHRTHWKKPDPQITHSGSETSCCPKWRSLKYWVHE